MTESERVLLRFLDEANTAGRFRRIADHPRGRHEQLASMEARGLVEQRPAKIGIRVRSAPFWRITDAGQKALADASPLPEERRAVVRWLRDPGACPETAHTSDACGACDLRRDLALAIERGVHRRGEAS